MSLFGGKNKGAVPVEDEMPLPITPPDIEKVVPQGPAQLLHWLTSLRQSPGWQWFMRRINAKSWRKMERWLKSDVGLEERETRNLEIREARAVFGIIRLLDDEIAKLENTLGKEEGE